MTLIKISRLMLLTAALLCLNIAGPASAQHIADNSQHSEAVRKMLRVTGFGEILLIAIKRNLTQGDPRLMDGRDQLILEALSSLTAETAIEKILPIYEQHISTISANSVTAFFDTPAGRRITQQTIMELQGKKGPRDSSDHAVLLAFEKSRVALEWSAAISKARPEVVQIARAWGEQVVNDYFSSNPSARLKMLESDPHTRQVVQLMREFSEKSSIAAGVFNKAMEKLEAQNLFEPSHLISAQRLHQNRQSISGAEKALEKFLSETRDLNQKLREEFRKLAQESPELRDSTGLLEKNLASGLEFHVNFSENQRSMINLFRNIIDFAESRLGKIALVDGKLLFDSDSDLATFRGLATQWRELAQTEEKLLKRASEARENFERLVRAPQTPLTFQPQASNSPHQIIAPVTLVNPPPGQQRRRFITLKTAGTASAYVERLQTRIRQLIASETNNSIEIGAIVTITISSSGNLEQVTIDRPSSNKAADDDLANLIRRSGPYERFSTDMLKEANILSITSTF